MAITKTEYINQLLSVVSNRIAKAEAAKASKAEDIAPRENRIDKIGHLEGMIADSLDARLRADLIVQLEKLQKLEEDDEAAIANYDQQIVRLEAQEAELIRLRDA